MGALHEGHRALVARASMLADAVVVSVFLNPMQFAPGEDLGRYPRTFASDLALCEAEGVAVVFAPDADEVYPSEPMVRVAAGGLGAVLEGASRPGHFDCVLTVVAKLFGLVQPEVAVFGEKDAQQLALVRRMVHDLDIPVSIEGVPIVRTPEGLALSSRNRFLDAKQRRAARTRSIALEAGSAVKVGNNYDAGTGFVDIQSGAKLNLGVKSTYMGFVLGLHAIFTYGGNGGNQGRRQDQRRDWFHLSSR